MLQMIGSLSSPKQRFIVHAFQPVFVVLFLYSLFQLSQYPIYFLAAVGVVFLWALKEIADICFRYRHTQDRVSLVNNATFTFDKDVDGVAPTKKSALLDRLTLTVCIVKTFVWYRAKHR